MQIGEIMTTTKKRPEVLVPAGTLEKLKVAVNYGADAVFVGGQAYGLRSRAGNFTMDELREGIEYAHARGVDVHVASNMVTHEGNEKGAGEWFRELRDMGLDAVIVSDPALIEICPIMHELLSEKDFGKYQDKTTGKMQLCFLTNNDITGGNSGSPMFNGKGELIGLAFDGNWDSLSSDINFDKRLARCIGVDIRYVLYLMDKWGHADRLLKEINAK